LKTKLPGEVAFMERFFMFERKPRSHSDMVKMFQRMYKTMPPGMYVMQTDTYGDTGDIVEREQLLDELQRMLEAYDRSKYGDDRFMYRIAGFRWMATTLKGALVQERARNEAREGQRQWNKKKREELRREIAASKKRTKKRK
jgi:hypothetical protein